MEPGTSATHSLTVFGTFGQLVDAFASLSGGSGLEIVVNLGFMGAFCTAGFFAGRFVARRSLPAAWIAAAVAGLAFIPGSQAQYFVLNAGIAFLGFLYPVWKESYEGLSASLPRRRR